MHIDPRIKEVLITAQQIEEAAIKSAKWIDQNYKGKKPLLLGILKGCVPFFAKVLNHITIDCEIDFIQASSFKGAKTSNGKVDIIGADVLNCKNKDIIIIDDVIDSGKTLLEIKNILLDRGASFVKILTMLDKPCKRVVDLKADYFCFEIGNYFLVGFGLDYQEEMRNLPYIGIFKDNIVK